MIGGHLHVAGGPDRVDGENGEVGYTLHQRHHRRRGVRHRRRQQAPARGRVTLVTYRDGRPVGIQPVTLQTSGRFAVAPWIPLDY